MDTIKTQIIELVNQIPLGKVTNYGTIGIIVGVSGQMVGWILSGMKQEEWELCPWHRVVAKDGTISSLKLGPKGMIQKQILIEEGFAIVDDKVDMSKHYFGFVAPKDESLF
jgi:methylated-DNA-protein-cysteine methyltransferase related protein